MDHPFTHARSCGCAAAFEKLTVLGYFSLGLILFGIGLYGFLILLQLVSSQYQQISV
jgi:hypothetical protein